MIERKMAMWTKLNLWVSLGVQFGVSLAEQVWLGRSVELAKLRRKGMISWIFMFVFVIITNVINLNLL